MRNIWSQISWLRTLLAGAAALIVGGVLLLCAHAWHATWYAQILHELGSVLIATVALLAIFDFWQKDALFRELFRHARSAEQLRAARISGFSSAFQDNVPWEDLFAKTKCLELMVAYGATWRNTHSQRLNHFLSNEGTNLRVILPDPENSDVVKELARRFSKDTASIRSKVQEAIEFFKSLRESFPHKVGIYLMASCPTHTFYRFDNEAVLALYPHFQGRTGVPTFVVERGGELYEFVLAECHSLFREAAKTGIVKEVP